MIGCPELELAFSAPSSARDFYALLYIEWANGDTRILSTAQVRLGSDAIEGGKVRLREWRFVCIETLDGGELKLQLSPFNDPGYIAIDALPSTGRFAELFQPLDAQCWLSLKKTNGSEIPLLMSGFKRTQTHI